MAEVAIRFMGEEIVTAGALAGLVFAGSLMLMSALVVPVDGFFLPLRIIAALALGPATLEPTYSLPVAVLTGFAIHILLSALFAVIFSAFVSPLWSRSALITGGMLFGLMLWLVNLHVIAPAAGWTWLVEYGSPLLLLVAHTLFFGCTLGWALSESRPVTPMRP